MIQYATTIIWNYLVILPQYDAKHNQIEFGHAALESTDQLKYYIGGIFPIARYL